MGSFTLNDLDDDMAAIIRELAEARAVSPEAMAAELIGIGLEKVRHGQNLRLKAEQIARMTPKGVAQSDSVLLIREERGR